jgi:formylmethanofuran dehydrogenase subunit B
MILAVCTGCSLLCEDIEVELKNGAISQAKNLCRKGHAHFQSLSNERTLPAVDGKPASMEEALGRAARILEESKRPLLYGWSSSSSEAQRVGIDLARKLEATLDGTPSCQGFLLERVLAGRLPSCTLDDVRNLADLSLFWGSDPSHSHPRMLSRFAYYPRGEKRQKSYEEERTCVVVDVRKSATATLCQHLIRLPPRGDVEFISAIAGVLEGKIPRTGDKKRMIELGTLLRKTEFGAIFCGDGLVCSQKEEADLFQSLIEQLNKIAPFRVLPMVGHYNSRGFNQLLLEQTGFLNRVGFQGGQAQHSQGQSIMEAARSCDAALVIGSDPLSSLPFSVSRALAKVPLIAIDPRRSLTTDAARVVIPSAMYGLEAAGSALRMDGVKVEFQPIVESRLMPDAEILKRIEEAV